MQFKLSQPDIEDLENMFFEGPPGYIVEAALNDVQTEWSIAGDKFRSFCYGIKVLEKIIEQAREEGVI